MEITLRKGVEPVNAVEGKAKKFHIKDVFWHIDG
jgi:hypothetical protein